MYDTVPIMHNHTEFSTLDGFSRMSHVVERAKQTGTEHVAVTDHGDCGGHLELQDACQSAGLNPIFAMEGYLVDSIGRVKAEKERKNSHYCVWAKNNEGLKNLWTLSSRAYIEGFYYRPLADFEMLKEHKEGLVFSDGCMLADMARYLKEDQYDRALEWAARNLDAFGDNFVMELHTWQFIDVSGLQERVSKGLTTTGNPAVDAKNKADAEEASRLLQLNADMTKINQGKVEVAHEMGIPLIVVNDSHYSQREDWKNHELVWQMSTNSDQIRGGETAAWIMDKPEYIQWLSKHGISRQVIEEAITNTNRLAENCHAEIKPKLRMPSVTGSPQKDHELYRETVEKGFMEKVLPRYEDQPEAIEEYLTRQEHEDSILIPRGFDGYFNVVSDFMRFAKGNGEGTPWEGKGPWLAGPGRGSGAGSLNAWLMDITEVDPLKYGLLFERFLNPERKGLPDFDCDFPRSKRGIMRDYVEWKYGKDHVCGIGTYGRLKPKSAIKDICRAMRVSYDKADQITKIVGKTPGVDPSWEEVQAHVGDELKPWREEFPEVFAKMDDLLGMIRQTGRHAAALIITNEPLAGNLPLRVKGGEIVSQFEMGECERLGFVKFDFLGLRHLDTLMQTDMMVNGDIDPNRFYSFTDEQYADPEVWANVPKGNTFGTFQLETSSMTKVGKSLMPRNEVDMTALTSINRPGVIDAGMLDEYLDRRNGISPVSVPHPLMGEVLDDTFGVIVFQEQVMTLFQVLAGYSLAEADNVRRIMGKRKKEEMDAEKVTFIQRCCEHQPFLDGYREVEHDFSSPRHCAEFIWEQIAPSAGYVFNRSHALAYSLISTWGLYQKHYHLAEYLTALLATDPENTKRYLKEARQQGIPILPPSVNHSGEFFTLTADGIRFGLSAVKGVGPSVIKEIMEKQPFEGLDDYLARCSSRGGAQKRVAVNLIRIGAFDEFGDRTKTLDDFYFWHANRNRSKKQVEEDVFKQADEYAPDFNDPQVVLDTEMELVGTYITNDPMFRYSHMIDDMAVKTPYDIEQEYSVGDTVIIGGQVTDIREHNARNGLMAWYTITWEDEDFTVTCFADSYASYKNLIKVGDPVMVTAKRQKDYKSSLSLLLVEMVNLTLV